MTNVILLNCLILFFVETSLVSILAVVVTTVPLFFFAAGHSDRFALCRDGFKDYNRITLRYRTGIESVCNVFCHEREFMSLHLPFSQVPLLIFLVFSYLKFCLFLSPEVLTNVI